MVGFNVTGSYKKTEKFLEKLMSNDLYSDFDRFGQMGVDALARATPLDTGETANSWGYTVTKSRNQVSIEWFNTHTTPKGVPIAILLQYGHGTGTGGYVSGSDYINPAIRPIFDQIESDFWKKVKNG